MPSGFRSKKIAVGAVSALVAIGAVGGSVAYAYPSATGMSASVTATALDTGGAAVDVTVYYANPACTINVDVAGNVGGPVVIAPRAGVRPDRTAVTAHLITSASEGQRKVTINATGCASKEKVQTAVDIMNARLETRASSYVPGERVVVTGYAFTPNSPMTFRLAPQDPDRGTVQTAMALTTGRGRGTASFLLPQDAATGAWVIVASTGNVSEPRVIDVRSS